MKQNPHAVEASLLHPDFGGEAIGGTLTPGRTQLQFQSETATYNIPLVTLEVEFERGGKGIFLSDATRPDVQIYTVNHRILRHPEIRSRPHVAALLSQRELMRAIRVTAYFAVACVVVIWLGSVAMGVMERAIVAKIPTSWEQKLGDNEVQKLRGENKLLDDTNDTAQLASLAAPLIESLPADHRNLKFYISNSEDPNAFALPGGYVIVNVGLLRLFDESGEVLAVLAHELGHQTRRHAVKRLVSGAGPMVLFGVLLHSDSGAGNILTVGSGKMIFSEYSRAYEIEADDAGWKYLAQANVDPSEMIKAFQKIEAWQESSGRSFGPAALQDHPSTEKRIERLQAKWEKLPRKTDFMALPKVEWSCVGPKT